MSAVGRKISGKIVGIEAGGEWLKIAVIDGAGSSPQISKLSLVPVQDGVDGLGKVFAGAWKSIKAGKEPIIACLPRQLVTVRMIELPSTDPAEIHDMVDLQVGKQTPYSKDEIVYDYKLVGGTRQGYTTVMLGIAQRSIVRQVFYAFEEAGIEIDRLTFSTEAVAALSARGGKGDACRAVLDVDSSFSDFIVMKGGCIQFSRSISVGADRLADSDSVSRLVKDVRSAIEAYRTERSGGAIGSVEVSGVISAVQPVVKELNEAGLKCSVKDAVTSLKRAPKADANMKNVSMSSLVGLAAAPGALEFNLVPDSISVRRGLVLKAKSLTAFGSLVMASLVCLSLWGSIRGFALRQDISSMKGDLAAVGQRAEKVADMMGIVRQVRDRKDPGGSPLGALLELRSALSKTGDRIKMSGVDFDAAGGTFLFTGMADDTKDIRSFVKALEQSECFADVRESGTASKKVGNERKYSFQVSGGLEAVK